MATDFARHLKVATTLIGLAFFAASLAPAEVRRPQLIQKPAQPDRERSEPQARFKQPPAPLAQGPEVPLDASTVPLPTDRPAADAPPPERADAPTERAVAPAVSDPVASPPPEARLNMVPTAPEQIGQVPGHFFWIRQGLQAAQDPVNGQIVFLSDEGRVLGRAALPPGFIIGEVYPVATEIRLIDAGRRQVSIPRTIDPAAAAPLQDAPVAASGGARTMRLTRRSDNELLYQDERRAGTRALSIRSIAGGTLAQAYEIGPGSGDNRYLVTEEIVSAKPALRVRVFVQRFDQTGRLTGVVHVPLEGMDSVPRDFITVTGDGSVRVLVPDDSGIKINEFEFAAPARAGRQLNDDDVKGLGRLLRTTPVDSNVMGEKILFRQNAPRLELTSPTPAITRDAVLQNARAYLTVNWVMERENFSKSSVENVCEPARAKFWKRPRSFTEAMIGTTIGPMPYRWGGDDTPDTFRVRAQLGALAGDICTCRSAAYNYCLYPESIGVDCSGFVSRAWGIEKRGTSGLLDVSNDVPSIGDLKPGDAFDWPGRHIRLLVGKTPGAALAFTVLESSTRLDCEGVCERTYRPSELSGFRLIRYRGISDSATAEVKR